MTSSIPTCWYRNDLLGRVWEMDADVSPSSSLLFLFPGLAKDDWNVDFSLSLYADSLHVCFKVSTALRITSCQAGMSLRGWYIGLSSRTASSLADFHSLPFIWSCVLFHSQFPSPSETHSFPSCPFCFALSLPHILPLFHLKSYHQLPSANHFLSRELWIKFKSVEFCLPPALFPPLVSLCF